jgi:hypothetical protein
LLAIGIEGGAANSAAFFSPQDFWLMASTLYPATRSAKWTPISTKPPLRSNRLLGRSPSSGIESKTTITGCK